MSTMSTIFSTLLNNILPDAGQFYSSREVSSQTLLMFHVIVDIFLKATTKKRYNDTAIQEPEPGTGTWNRA